MHFCIRLYIKYYIIVLFFKILTSQERINYKKKFVNKLYMHPGKMFGEGEVSIKIYV